MQIYGRKFSTIQQQYQHWNISLPYHDRVIGRIGLQYRACKNKHVPFLSNFFWNRWRKKIMREPADPTTAIKMEMAVVFLYSDMIRYEMLF